MVFLALQASAVVPSLLLLWYFHSRDVYPEPARVVWATFGLGVLSTIPVLLADLPLGAAVEALGGLNPYAEGLSHSLFLAAIPEEFFKYLVLVLYAARHKEFNEPMDGVVYGVSASLGFATLENILYVSQGGLGVAVMRAVTAVPSHALMGAIMGYYVGRARFAPLGRRALTFKALAV
ncbi:MAG: PrsW family glutamic-type intramembrane protease, partial [Thermodesulfobacteriota bacterium]